MLLLTVAAIVAAISMIGLALSQPRRRHAPGEQVSTLQNPRRHQLRRFGWFQLLAEQSCSFRGCWFGIRSQERHVKA